ncbi:MAG TPA: hypothetical protein VGL29_04840 [Blastocatellia bacterium]|jgi:hypothetical protein
MKPFYFAKRKFQLVPAATILVVLAISASTSAQSITTFDAPGAGTGPLQGTYATNIGPSGTIIGFSRDANNVRHGFIRSQDGSFTIYDAPGAGTAAGQGTRAYGTNPIGTITGHFTDSVNTAHGYVRSNQGVITVFDAPGAGTGPGRGTFVTSPLIINSNGAIAGWAIDSAGVYHGFLRDRNGVITTFDAPGAGTGANQGTLSFAISPRGEITGFYFDGNTAVHGFLRDEEGVITAFDVPGAGTGANQGTFGGGFTPDGTIMGVYADADSLYHGFLLDKNGAVTTFDAPDAGNVPGSFQGTVPWGINTNGEITGYYTDGTNVNHGFVRDKQGAIVEFDAPGAGMGFWASIAPNGAVTSHYFDVNNVVHGFVRDAAGQ